MLGFNKCCVEKMGFVFRNALAFPILGALVLQAADTLDLNATVALLALYGFVRCFRGLAWWRFDPVCRPQHTMGCHDRVCPTIRSEQAKL